MNKRFEKTLSIDDVEKQLSVMRLQSKAEGISRNEETVKIDVFDQMIVLIGGWLIQELEKRNEQL